MTAINILKVIPKKYINYVPLVGRTLSQTDVDNLMALYKLDRLGIIDRILANFKKADSFDRGDLPGHHFFPF